MKKTVSLWTLALLILAAPVLAEATTVSIKVTRVAGGVTTTGTATPTVTFTDAAGKPAVALACSSNAAGVANSTAGNAVCTRTILIGTTLAVTIRDISTSNRARVYRDDAQSSDILNVAGTTAITGPAATGATLTFTVTYSSNEFTKLNYNLYGYTASMSGNYFSSAGVAPSACSGTPTPPPCLTLKLTANNITVNQFGDNAVATVNAPPFGAGGAFGPSSGNPAETKSIPCGTSGVTLSCTPSLQGELQAISKAASDTLKIVGGAAIGGSHRPITAGGVTDTFVDVAEPEFVTPGSADFVRYIQEATLHASLDQDQGLFPKIGQGSIPLNWNLDKVYEGTNPPNPNPFTPIRLRSLVNADLFDDGAYVSWVPTTLGQVQARDLTSIVADFNVVTGPTCSTSNSSLVVEIQLVTLQTIQIPLCGSDAVNLVTSTANIVKLPDGSTTNWKGMLPKFGGVNIRAISVVLTPVAANQEVDLASFTVGVFKLTFTQGSVQAPSFTDQKCDMPGLNEFTVRATPVDVNGVPVGAPFIWGAAPGETFQKLQDAPTAGDCQLFTSIPINRFPPKDRQNAWQFELLYNLVPSGLGTVFVSNNN